MILNFDKLIAIFLKVLLQLEMIEKSVKLHLTAIVLALENVIVTVLMDYTCLFLNNFLHSHLQ